MDERDALTDNVVRYGSAALICFSIAVLTYVAVVTGHLSARTLESDAALEALRDLPVKLRLEQRERVDWLDHYQQSLTPLFIGRDFVIAPDESLLTTDRKHRLVIPQAQAFGTGSHESTALCIELLEE